MSSFDQRMYSIMELLSTGQDSQRLFLAAQQCAQLRVAFPNEAPAYQISAVCSTYYGNFEAEQFFLSEVARLSPDASSCFNDLEAALRRNNAIYSAEEYMEKMKEGKETYLTEIFQKAHQYFKSKNYEESDALIQQACALKNPETSPLHNLVKSREFTERFETQDAFENRIEKMEDNFQSLWLNVKNADVKLNDEILSSTMDRQWTTKIIIDFLKDMNNPSPQILELGCYTGYNLANVSKAAENEEFVPILTGIEPYKPAVEYGRSKYPKITFHEGTFQDWIQGKFPTPKCYDVILLNRILQIFKPEKAKEILSHAKKTCRYLVIADDVMNWEGDKILMRGDFIMLYPFKKYLEEHGFEILNLLPAETPDRAFTGCIIARNTDI